MEKNKAKETSNREVKSSAFTTYFSDPKNAAQLYSALNGTEVAPEFYVFYNGDAPFPAEATMKLSDAYLEKTDDPMLELVVKVININLPVNHELLMQCRPLYEYSWFIQKIKEYLWVGFSRDEAITQTIKDCGKEGIMVDFVREHGSEAVNMIFTQFNMEDALEVRYEEGFEDGFENGEEKGRVLMLMQMILRKLQKGKAPSVIAEELEEAPEVVEKICKAVESCGMDGDMDKIYEEWKRLP